MPSTPSRRQGLVLAAVVLLIAALAAPVAAQTEEPDTNGFSFFVSGYFPSVDSSFQTFTPDGGISDPIDMEDDLGVDDSATALRLGLAYRFGRTGKHQIELSYLEIDRDGDILLDRDIEFGDEIFNLNANVATEVITRDIDLSYTYFFVANEKGEFGMSLGVHAVRAESSLVGSVQIGEDIDIPLAEESVSKEVPLPLIGLRGGAHISDKLDFDGGIKILEIDIDDVEGRFIDFWLRLSYRIHEHFHLGAGWTLFDVDVEQVPGDSTILRTAQWEYSGPEVFIRVPF